MKVTIKIGIVLFFGLLTTEIGVLIEYLVPNANRIYIDNAFINKSYHVKGLTIPYYFYEIAGYWYNVIIYACWYASIKKVYKKLSYIVLTFLCYHLIQTYFYLYDRNTSFYANWATYTLMVFIILELFIPEKKTARIKIFD